MSSEFPPVMILCGGLGTRLGAMAARQPKAMIEVAGEPFITHQLRLLAREKVSHVVLCVSYMHEQISDYVGDGQKFGLAVEYAQDGETRLGTGGAILKAMPMVGDQFAVLYGDTYLDIKFAPILECFRRSGKLGLMTVLANENRWDRSNILMRDQTIVRYDKHNPAAEMKHIDYGLSVFKKDALSRFHSLAKPLDLADVFHNLIASQQLAGYEVTQRFYEIGTPAALAETEEYLRSVAAR